MNWILLIFSIFMNFLSCGLLRNEFCKRDVKNNADLYIFNAFCSIISMIVLVCIGLYMGDLMFPSLYTVILGILFGIVTALCALFAMKALESGPMSYTNVIANCSMVIPALSGLILYSEPVSMWQWAGTILMIISIVCSVDKSNNKSGASLKWLLLCLGTFGTNGLIGILQKVHQNSSFKNELGAFLIIAFGISAIFSFALALGFQKRKKEQITVLANKSRFIVFGLISGLGIAACNQINMYLAGAMPSIIFFPVANGASLLLNCAAGFILWKERFSAKQWIGLAAGCCAIILLCNIF